MVTYYAWDVSKDATCGRGKERKKGQKLLCVNLAISQTTHVDIGPWNFVCKVVSGSIYITRFVEIAPGVSELWGGGEICHVPLSRPMDYTTVCTTVQAVISRSKLHSMCFACTVFYL